MKLNHYGRSISLNVDLWKQLIAAAKANNTTLSLYVEKLLFMDSVQNEIKQSSNLH